jgi:cathepsin A (carboxypeptidase C)
LYVLSLSLAPPQETPLTQTIDICNWLGNKAWTEALEWPGQKSYSKASYDDLLLSSDKKTKIGSVKSSGNFTFIRIGGGGHMVPYDQPVASLDFVNRWVSGEWLE